MRVGSFNWQNRRQQFMTWKTFCPFQFRFDHDKRRDKNNKFRFRLVAGIGPHKQNITSLPMKGQLLRITIILNVNGKSCVNKMLSLLNQLDSGYFQLHKQAENIIVQYIEKKDRSESLFVKRIDTLFTFYVCLSGRPRIEKEKNLQREKERENELESRPARQLRERESDEQKTNLSVFLSQNIKRSLNLPKFAGCRDCQFGLSSRRDIRPCLMIKNALTHTVARYSLSRL